MTGDGDAVRALRDGWRRDAIRQGPALTPRTLHVRQWVAFGVALSAHIRADPALLESATTSAARWIVEGSAHVPRSLHDWQFLCAPGDVDSVLLALETMSEYADVMRVSHPLVGILTMAAWPRSALARGDEPVPQMPRAV